MTQSPVYICHGHRRGDFIVYVATASKKANKEKQIGAKKSEDQTPVSEINSVRTRISSYNQNGSFSLCHLVTSVV